MPPTSARQARAMYAAAEGHSTLGIPKEVGEEYIAADAVPRAAGVVLLSPDNCVLLLCRALWEPNYGGYWGLPGGGGEDGETALETAFRELSEEIGDNTEHSWLGEPTLIDEVLTPNGLIFSTFLQPVRYKFIPELNNEHSGYVWASMDQLPDPIHPGVEAVLMTKLGARKMAMDRTITNRDVFALDKNTVRSVDEDGRMRVEITNISKANVCPYYGKEIPDCETLHLDPEKIYRLYRHPDELKKAAATFNNLPLLSEHVPVSPDDHKPDLVMGATGSDAVFDHPHLKNSLIVWAQKGIDAVESGSQKELSSAYRYRADMTPGISPEGERYDGIMRDISGNHVALVKEGRAGPDVVVGDSMPARVRLFARDGVSMFSPKEPTMAKTILTRKAAVAKGVLIAYLSPKLAQDAMINLTPVLAKVTAKNWGESKDKIVADITKITTGKLATDAKLDDIMLALDAIDDEEPAEDAMEPSSGGPAFAGKPRGQDAEPEDKGGKLRDFLKGKLSEDDMKACDAIMDNEDDEDDQEAMDADEPNEVDNEGKENKETTGIGKKAEDKRTRAMDRATIIQLAKDEVLKSQREVRKAEADVRPYVGDLAMAYDSAPEVYRAALTALGVPGAASLHPDALLPILKAQKLPGSSTTETTGTTHVAMDAASVNSFHDMFGTNAVKQL